MKYTTCLFLFSMLITFWSCDIINPEEEVPAFIEFSSVELITDFGNEGSNFHNISNLSVFSSTEAIGVFEPSAKIPVLNIGTQNFLFEPGIKENGISYTRMSYPFYNTLEKEITTVPGETSEVSLAFRYRDDIVFETIEDFENGNEIDPLQGSVFPLITTKSDEVLEGNRSLAIRLPNAEDSFEGESIDYNFPSNSTAYIEIDYTCNQLFSVGIISVSGGNRNKLLKVTIIPSEVRNKIYINVSDLIQDNPGESYRVYIKADKDESIEEGTIIIDNMKLVRSE